MAAKRPELETAPLPERFPLAARALRMSTVRQPRVQAQDADAPVRTTTRNNWPLYLFIFLLPLQNIQFNYLPNFGGGLNFLNVMTLTSLLGAFYVRGKMAANESVNRWVFAYAIYMVASLFIGYQSVSNTETHFAELKDHLLGVFVLVLVQKSATDWTAVRRMIACTLLPLPYVAKVVWTQHVSVATYHYSDDLRINGTFLAVSANEFAAFCVTVSVVLFALLLATKLPRRWKLALLMGVACMVFGVLYAYSRTAYVALILGAVTVVLAWRGRWKMMLPLLLTVAILPAVLPSSVIERFDSTTVKESDRDESTEMRIVYWGVAWDNFLHHPVTGTGYHTFHHKEVNPYGKDTHNLYIRTLTEGGVIGAVILLGVLFSILRAARRELSRAPTGSLHYGLALGLVGAWMALLVGNLFGDRFTYYPMIAYFWLYVALVIKARHLPPEGKIR
jgi:putative inorganic carbon (hco3(-)) transporter